MVNLNRDSLARAMLLSMIAASVVPILILTLVFVNESSQTLIEEAQSSYLQVVASKSEEMNSYLIDISRITQLASREAAVALQNPVSDAEIYLEMSRYQRDSHNVLGLDMFYNGVGGGEAVLGTELSNVYWGSPDAPNEAVARSIAQTLKLDTTFGSIKAISPNTQWIYFTTPEGMMRIYPWGTNDHYPDNWDPRQVVFYTVAEPANNPTLELQWTPPYVDFAGAGWMVTVSNPVIDREGQFLGVMSQDITIVALLDIVRNIQVLDGSGYAFLIDNEGNVIAHPAYQQADATQGSQTTTNLLREGGDDYRGLIQQMVSGGSGTGYYHDAELGDQLLVYAPINSIGWSLGIVVPQSELVRPAQMMQQRALIIASVIIFAVVILAVVLTRRVHKPLEELLGAVQQVSEEGRRADHLKITSFVEINELARAFNDMAAKVWERERKLKSKVSELSIEIDAQRRASQVQTIVESEYFQYLQSNAQKLRNQVKGTHTKSTEEPA